MNNQIKFVIINSGRSGSTMLIDWLNNNPGIFCHYGVFSPGSIALFIDKDRNVFNKKAIFWRNLFPMTFLNILWELSRKKFAAGFKLYIGRTFIEEIMVSRVIRDPGIKKIFLYRNNVVRSYVSARVSMKLGKPNTKKEVALTDRKVTINVKRFKLYALKVNFFVNRTLRKMKKNPDNSLVLEYKELLSEDIFKRVADFLNIPFDPSIKTSIRKLNPEKIENIVNNYDELKVALKGTSYENMMLE